MNRNVMERLSVVFPNAYSMDNKIIVPHIIKSINGATKQVQFEVSLPQNFPHGKPTVILNPQGILQRDHSIINRHASNLIVHNRLLNWSPALTLESTLEEVIAAIDRDPPHFNAGPSTSYNTNSSSSNNNNNSSRSSSNSLSSFSEIDKLDNQQLNVLLNSDAKIEEFVRNMAVNQELMREVEKMEEDNVAVARKKLDADTAARPKIEALNAKRAELKTAYEHYEKLYRENNELKSKFQLRNLYEALSHAQTDAERQADLVVSNFRKGKCDLDEFMDTFKEKRTLANVRAQKCLRLKHQLDSQQQQQQQQQPVRDRRASMHGYHRGY